MPFYRGDYYRGDYYRGDLFGRIGAGLKGFATGGILGGIAGLTGMSGGPKQPPAPPPGTISQGGVFGGITQFFSGKPVLNPAAQIRGYHPNKSNEYDPSQHGKIVVPKGSKMVRNRHMNVANPRALARAARRAHGFLRLASRFTRYYSPHKHKGRAYIGRRKKSR